MQRDIKSKADYQLKLQTNKLKLNCNYWLQSVTVLKRTIMQMGI